MVSASSDVTSMNEPRTIINDSWVLSRAGHFSSSFSNFLSTLPFEISDEKRKKIKEKLNEVPGSLEKALKTAKSLETGEIKAPIWVKPFISRIIQQVSNSVTSELSQVASQLFGTEIFSLSKALHDVAKERGITNERMLYLIDMLPEFEALMYFLNVRKFYRDHCAHQLRVAVLGDFLLNLRSGAGSMESIIKDKLGLSSEEVRTAWWFAGLLHDTGIPLAKLCSAINWSLLNEILRCYPSLDIKASPLLITLSSNDTKNREYLAILAEGMSDRWRRMLEQGLGVSQVPEQTNYFRAGYSVRQEYQPKDLQIDHGVVGAVNLLRTLGTSKKLQKNLPEDRPLIEAARAISIHNFKDTLGSVPFEEFPLAFLLVLCDELQEWSRPVPVPVKDTYFTTSLEKVALLDEISYTRPNELWDIPYANEQAKKLAKFDFRKLCKDKAGVLDALDCTEQFPESEIQLRNIEIGEPKREEKFSVEVKTR
jgi:hypothetical protein